MVGIGRVDNGARWRKIGVMEEQGERNKGEKGGGEYKDNIFNTGHHKTILLDDCIYSG